MEPQSTGCRTEMQDSLMSCLSAVEPRSPQGQNRCAPSHLPALLPGLLMLLTACSAQPQHPRSQPHPQSQSQSQSQPTQGQSHSPFQPRSQPESQELNQAYQRAIKDAERAEPREVSRQLTAIVPDNPHLIFRHRHEPQQAAVLVVTWTNYNGYDKKIHQTLTLAREVWVTVVPELQNRCRTIRGARTLRLEQLLGLPPHAGKNRFVQLWVRPTDLFRPSADPEISDTTASAEAPAASTRSRQGHRQWFARLRLLSYGRQGFPWTRLGYTYDWGKPGHPIGLSEFVIRAGAVVEVDSISPERLYCQADHPDAPGKNSSRQAARSR